MRTKIAFMGAALMLAMPVFATPSASTPSASAERPEEARIPFVNYGSVRNFRPVSDDVVYFQDSRRNWYRAELSVPCFNIRSALRIGVDTRFGGTLDNTSSLLVDGERCPIHSLVRSGPPPERERP